MMQKATGHINQPANLPTNRPTNQLVNLHLLHTERWVPPHAQSSSSAFMQVHEHMESIAYYLLKLNSKGSVRAADKQNQNGSLQTF